MDKGERVEVKSTTEKNAEGTAPQSQEHAPSVVFGNPQQRKAHIHAFLAWLPPILHQAPGIRWECLPSKVMGYLIRRVADNPDAICIALAIGCAMDAMKPKILYDTCGNLTNLLERLRRDYGMTTLAELGRRTIWDQFVEGRMISAGELHQLTRYDALASIHLPAFFEGLTERQQTVWEPYLLPKLPRKFIDNKAQRKAVDAVSQDRRKQRSDVILPLFPLLVEIAQLRKQAAERLLKEFRKQRERFLAGEIALPYQFQYVDRQFLISEHATALSEVQLMEREVTLSLTLWDRSQWVKRHPDLYRDAVRRRAKQQQYAYASERNACFLQYEGPSGDLLWIGDLIKQHRLKRSTQDGFVVQRPGLLSPVRSDAHWLNVAMKRSGVVLFEPESLYRGVLFAAALATLSLTNGSRVSELLQVSASRFETIVVDELKNQQPTGRKIGLLVQKLLPKGYTQESERQFFLISDMAVRHLKEISEMLRAAHDGTIPVVHPQTYLTKADDLVPEPYFFQWAASEDGRIGHLRTNDVSTLLRFLFHGLTLTTRTGEPIRVVPHLLRHVLSTHARTVQNIPAEAIAYLLHHRITLPSSTRMLTISGATAYYSRLPVTKLLALLFEVQSTLVSDQGRSYLQVPSPQTLEQMDEALRKQFEHYGMIGPTVLGYCSAGTCVRPDNRGICANCPHLVPHYSNLSNAKTWRRLYVLQAQLHDDRGHAVEAGQARKVIQYLDDMIRIMEIQIQTRADGGYLPFADTLPPAQDEEGVDQ